MYLIVFMYVVCFRFSNSKYLDKAAGIKARERKKFLLQMQGWDEEADREAWSAFEELQNKKIVAAPAPAMPIGDPAPVLAAVAPQHAAHAGAPQVPDA